MNGVCQSTNVILTKTGSLLNLSLRVGTNSEADHIFGTLTATNWVAMLQGDRAVFNAKTNIAPLAGNYTLIIAGQSGDASVPAGHGYGTVKVDGGGKITFAGSLADGSKVTQSSAISKSGVWPFYLSVSKGAGSALSWLTFENRSNDDIHGNLTWIKQTNALAKFYPAGFTLETEALGSAYVIPGIGQNILGLSSATVSFDGGNLGAGFANSLTLGSFSTVVNNSGNALSMSFSLLSGTFKGKVTNPANNLSYSFNGVVVPKMNAGYGYMLGTNQSSQVIFGP
jgi:hypothetical protein